MKIPVFDFFSSCGRTGKGLEQASMEGVLGMDINADAEKTFQRNFPKMLETTSHVGDGNFKASDLILHLNHRCLRDGLKWDDDLVTEVLGL